MSISRINFTGRKRISHEHVTIGITGAAPSALIQVHFNLKNLGFPETARVVLEAQAGWTVQRFDFGTVGQFSKPNNLQLTDFHSLEGLLFRLKVIATGDHDGRLLGVADKLRHSGDIVPAAQQSFVVVRPSDIGDRVWKVDFDESQPILLVNTRIHDCQDFLKRREVAALVFPEVLQRILEMGVKLGSGDEGGDGWPTLALGLGEQLTNEPVPAADNEDEIERWVDAAVGAFSQRHELIDVFVTNQEGPLQ